jgi:hypothetical protein
VQENFFTVFSIASSVQENFFFSFFYCFIGDKILPNKIVSLYSIFFSKIVYWYHFNQYILEYPCPPLLIRALSRPLKSLSWPLQELLWPSRQLPGLLGLYMSSTVYSLQIPILLIDYLSCTCTMWRTCVFFGASSNCNIILRQR